MWGLKVWWVQERRKGFLEASVLERPDCPEGVECERQKDQGEFLLLGFLFVFRLLLRVVESGDADDFFCGGSSCEGMYVFFSVCMRG